MRALGRGRVGDRATGDAQSARPDIVAARDGIRLEVEPKGAGSSLSHTARYGLPFTAAQVRVHVGEAVLNALRVVAVGKHVRLLRSPTPPATGPRWACTTSASVS